MAAQYAQKKPVSAPAPTLEDAGSIYDYMPSTPSQAEKTDDGRLKIEEESIYDMPKTAAKPKKAGSDIKVPKRILRAVRKETNPGTKVWLLYWFLRRWAEEQQAEGRHFDAFRVARENYNNLQYAEAGECLNDMMADMKMMVSSMPYVSRLFSDTTDIADLIVRETERLSGKRLSFEKEVGMAFLYVRFGLHVLAAKQLMERMDAEDEEEINEQRREEEDERAMQKRYADAIEQKGFPVDAQKLIRNYFHFSEKDPDKAYEILVTSPFYFSPLIPEKYNGGKVTPDAARSLNKKLGAFLKGLKA